MALHWKNNHLLTHIGDDYVRCDIFDFGTRKISYDEIRSVRYGSRPISFGGLPTVATIVLAVIVWAFITGIQKDRMDVKGEIIFTVIGCLFAVYVGLRAYHCLRNRRRFISLSLNDGTEGTLFEIEDDSTFNEARSIIDQRTQNKRMESNG